MNADIHTHRQSVALWLLICCLCVAWMTAIGGWTRLTESGLSITEWAPVTGTLPPIGEEQWRQAFADYKATPEYKHLRDADMTLDEFKRIYMPEYLHRLSGRFVGFAFFVPLLFFWYKKAFTARQRTRLIVVGALGAFQGLVGWLMVKSGLKESPYVSHSWLAFHLSVAFTVFALLWTGFLEQRDEKRRFNFNKGECVILIWMCLQIIWGALVAGKNAGFAFGPEFPLMNGEILPEAAIPASFFAFFYDPMTLHATHRLSGILLCAFVICYYFYHIFIHVQPKRELLLLAIGTICQIGLGAATVMTGVSVHTASAHQLFALVLFALTLTMGYTSKERCIN